MYQVNEPSVYYANRGAMLYGSLLTNAVSANPKGLRHPLHECAYVLKQKWILLLNNRTTRKREGAIGNETCYSLTSVVLNSIQDPVTHSANASHQLIEIDECAVLS